MIEKEKKPKKVAKNPEGQPIEKEFVFKLTKDESNAKGRASAGIGKEILEMKAKLKELVKSHTDRINTRQEMRDTLDEAILAQEEKRTVKAVMRKNYDVREIAYYFEGECIEKRTMTENELQMEANFQKAEKARAPRQPLENKEAKRKRDLVEKANGVSEKDADIAEVVKLETGRRTKSSSVDGPIQ